MKLLSILGIISSAAVLGAVVVDQASATRSETADDVEASFAGRVVFEGEVPQTVPLPITEKQSVGCCPDGVDMNDKNRTLLVSEGKGIANVVVTVDVKDAEVKVPDEPFSIDQKMCRFEPHVMVLPVGSTMEFLNSDGVAHNVHTYATKNDSLNKTIAPGGKESQKLTKTDKIKISCDIHPWMNGWVFVTDTPYFAVSDGEGNFEIEGLAPGEYKADYWHEKLGKTKGSFTIAADGTVENVEVKMGLESKGKGKRRRKR